MRFSSELVRGRLVKRYKRFLADVVLDDGGGQITATVPNTGSMMGLSDPGLHVWLSTNDSPTRKYRHTLELVEVASGASGGTVKTSMVGINTGSPNKIVREAIAEARIEQLAGYASIRNEVRYGINSRIDLLLEDTKLGLCYVEIKNVHLSRSAGLAEFPDSVTERGAKHLVELGDMVEAGHRAVMVYLIQRGDCERLSFAADIDPNYARAFLTAQKRGVEAIACCCAVSTQSIDVDRTIEIAI
ncbi:MAG: DNA/RNA nuclease SfsA [Hyphomicrobiaceae bacterium]|nr:DNA/RNA nuclease SfsA [Hyphomicrobiaceae bacterium]